MPQQFSTGIVRSSYHAGAVAIALAFVFAIPAGSEPNAAAEHTSPELMTGQAWVEFCERLKEVGKEVLAKDVPSADLDRAEAYRFMVQQLERSIDAVLDTEAGAFAITAGNVLDNVNAAGPGNHASGVVLIEGPFTSLDWLHAFPPGNSDRMKITFAVQVPEPAIAVLLALVVGLPAIGPRSMRRRRAPGGSD